MALIKTNFMSTRLNDINNRNDVIYDVLCTISDDNLVELHNKTYVEHYPDDRIYNNNAYEFNSVMGEDKSPWEIASELEGTDFDTNDSYFAFDGRGNIKSFNSASDYIDIHDLADYLEKNGGVGIKEDWLDEDDIRYVFAYNFCAATKLTEDEIEDIAIMDFILEDWNDIIANVIADREE